MKIISRPMLSNFLLPAGFQSSDGSAVLGADGYVFLFKGSNDVAILYAEAGDKPEIRHRVDKWHSIIKERFWNLNRLGVQFLQVIIPEKSSVILSEVGRGLGPITITLEQLEELFTASLDPYKDLFDPNPYVSVVSELREMADTSRPPFLKTDSHLSVHGAKRVFERLLDAAVVAFPSTTVEVLRIRCILKRLQSCLPPIPFQGDLAQRMLPPGGVWEEVTPLDISSVAALATRVAETSIYKPDAGQHIGYHIRWQNPDAILKLKLLVFGNSFFERGAAPRGLSWWCKTFFSEFHFVWSPSLNYELVERVRPDIVICQTIERFLAAVPSE